MILDSPPSLLLIGVAKPHRSTAQVDVCYAISAAEALAAIRFVTFDLLVVGLEKPAIDVWGLVRRVHAAWPRQRWMLLSGRVTTAEEVEARSLGAVVVMHDLPHPFWLAEFADSLRRRNVPSECVHETLAPFQAGNPVFEIAAAHERR